MAVKLPAIQWYPGDWLRDPGVQSLSYEDQGIWFAILMRMWEGEERGKLTLNGQAMPVEALARLLGLDNQKVNQTLTTLLTYGVTSVEPTTGIIYSRRMVRDENLRKTRAECGKLGGNPVLLNQKSNQSLTTGVKVAPTPSSSSSSSSSDVNPLPPTAQPPAILTPDDVGYWVDLIMELYPTPADSRSVYRWVDDNDNRLSAKGRDKFLNFMTEVQIGLEEWKEYWASRGNEFVPDVMKWLHGCGWKKHPPKPKPLLDGPMYDDGRPL